MHISILNYTLFPECPSFYSCNKLMDEKNYHIYSDKFALNVLDLKQIDLATADDKRWKLDYWARLFQAATWEEIKMIASDNEYLQEASNALYDLNADFNVRERCRNREEYYGMIRTFEDEIDTMKEVLAHTGDKLAHVNNDLAQSMSELAQSRNELAQSRNELAQSMSELAQSRNELAQKDLEIEKLQAEIARLKSTQNA